MGLIHSLSAWGLFWGFFLVFVEMWVFSLVLFDHVSTCRSKADIKNSSYKYCYRLSIKVVDSLMSLKVDRSQLVNF